MNPVRWVRHPLFAPGLVLAALVWSTLLLTFLLVGPNLGGWAQTVLTTCFGWNAATRAYRLDTVVLLTLEPPLFVLVVALFYGGELRAFVRRTGGRVASAAAAVGFVAAALGLVLGTEVVAGPTQRAPVPVRDGRPAPRVHLVDHRGVPFTLGGPLDRPLALTFVYADCHTACPALVATLKAVEARVGDRARFAAVTLVPETDTPARLADLAARWQLSPAWRLLTGESRAVDDLRLAWGIAAERLADGSLAHTAAIVLLDRAGRVAFVYRGLGQPVEDLARVLAALGEERV
jgi:protein SCO1/2